MKDTIRPDDTELVQRLKMRDPAAFKSVHDSYGPMLLRFAQGILKDRARAEDAVQEGWAALHESIERFEGRSSLKQWLYAIVSNKARSIARRERRVVHFAQFDEGGGSNDERFTADGRWAAPPAPWHDLTPERLLDGRQLATFALEFMDDLPENQRAVVVLRDVEGFSAREACDLLGITDANQRILLHRGRSRIRERIDALLR